MDMSPIGTAAFRRFCGIFDLESRSEVIQVIHSGGSRKPCTVYDYVGRF